MIAEENMTEDDEVTENNSIREFVDKPGRIYKCPRKDCLKSYKNRAGLKYHLLKGQCKNRLTGTPMTPMFVEDPERSLTATVIHFLNISHILLL